MWVTHSFVADVDAVARVFYVGAPETKAWNEQRRTGEPRLMSGWVWAARDGSAERSGLKTMTAAYIDAWWHLVQHAAPPSVSRKPKPRLRVVSRRAA